MSRITKNIQIEICIIMLTHNRSEYLERCLNSIYLRVGQLFELYIFDDNSDKQTILKLKQLQKKYKFNLFLSKRHRNIAHHFVWSVKQIKKKYKYYLKLDSDIEILTDNLFTHFLDVIDYTFDNRSTVCVIPRVEGAFIFERAPNDIDFYNGHYIRIKTAIMFGCAMFIKGNIFRAFFKNLVIPTDMKWGIDTKIYEYCQHCGYSLVLEDSSVYHIDNNYGQRRKYADYFITRNRWKNNDTTDIWFALASKEIYPKYLKREIFEFIMHQYEKEILTYSDFLKYCKKIVNTRFSTLADVKVLIRLLNNTHTAEIQALQKDISSPQMLSQKTTHTRTIYKITSPINFMPSKNMKHGTIQYFKTKPDWSLSDVGVVTEKIIVLYSVFKTIQFNTERTIVK